MSRASDPHLGVFSLTRCLTSDRITTNQSPGLALTNRPAFRCQEALHSAHVPRAASYTVKKYGSSDHDTARAIFLSVRTQSFALVSAVARQHRPHSLSKYRGLHARWVRIESNPGVLVATCSNNLDNGLMHARLRFDRSSPYASVSYACVQYLRASNHSNGQGPTVDTTSASAGCKCI
jgi:hypothetical protein